MLSDLKAASVLMQVPQVKAIVAFLEDDLYTFAEQAGHGAVGAVSLPS